MNTTNRKILVLAVGTPLLWASVSGCSNDFLGEEMRLGEGDKIRPLGIVIDPPEAPPGAAVDVTLYWYDPNPAASRIEWRVALEYDPGGYGVDPIERRFVNLDAESGVVRETTDQGDGFFTQTFSYTVPDSVLLWSPAMASLFQSDEVEALAGPLSEWADPTPMGWNTFFASLGPGDLEALDPSSRALLVSLADLFAARIRFHAMLEHGSTVAATRSLTVRYSSAVGSPNVNENTRVSSLALVGLPHDDVVWSERGDYEGGMTWTVIAAGDEVAPLTKATVQPGWTYYLVCEGTAQSYRSPYSSGSSLEELIGFRWYRFRAADPSSATPFFVSDGGDEADAYDLDEAVRIEPAAGERYRVCVVLRDERPEWAQYQASPGQRVVWTDLVFE